MKATSRDARVTRRTLLGKPGSGTLGVRYGEFYSA